jgi:hypothetical protein
VIGVAVIVIGFMLIFTPVKPTPPPYDTCVCTKYDSALDKDKYLNMDYEE